MLQKIAILLVDDHQVVLEGVKAMLMSSTKHDYLIFVASSGKQALKILETEIVDVVITDITMPEMTGIELTQHLKKKHPHLKVLLFTMHNEREFIRSALAVDADGYLLKTANKIQYEKAIAGVVNDGVYYDENVIAVLREEKKIKLENTTIFKTLTEKELEIIKLLCQEYSSEEIAEKLFLSKHSINAYRKSILQKTNTKNAIGIMRFAIQQAIV